jgi:hypothetical protein
MQRPLLPEERALDTHWTGGRMDLDTPVRETGKILTIITVISRFTESVSAIL